MPLTNASTADAAAVTDRGREARSARDPDTTGWNGTTPTGCANSGRWRKHAEPLRRHCFKILGAVREISEQDDQDGSKRESCTTVRHLLIDGPLARRHRIIRQLAKEQSRILRISRDSFHSRNRPGGARSDFLTQVATLQTFRPQCEPYRTRFSPLRALGAGLDL